MAKVYKMEQNALFYIKSAKDYINEGDSENAIRYIRRALAQEKKSQYYIMLGKEYSKIGEDDFAVYCFLKVLNTDPVSAFTALIINAYESGNLPAVVYYMSLMLEAVPPNEASKFISEELYETAFLISEQALAENADEEEVMSFCESRYTPENKAFKRGIEFYGKGKFKEAKEELLKVSEKSGNYLKARSVLSEISLLKNDFPSAYILAEELYERNKLQGISEFLTLSLLSSDRELFKKAVGYIEKLSNDEEDYFDLIERAFYISTHFEMYDISEKFLAELIKEFPLDSEYMLIDAIYSFNRKNKKDAFRKVKLVKELFGVQSSALFVENLMNSDSMEELPYVGSKAYIELCVLPMLKNYCGTTKKELYNAFYYADGFIPCLNELFKYWGEWTDYPKRLALINTKEIKSYLNSLMSSPFVYDEIKADIFVELVKNGLRGTYLILFEGKLLGGDILVPDEFEEAGNIFKSAYANVVLRLYEMDRGIDFKKLYVAVKTVLPLSHERSETAICAVLLKTYMGVDITENDALDAFSATKATFKKYSDLLKN